MLLALFDALLPPNVLHWLRGFGLAGTEECSLPSIVMRNGITAVNSESAPVNSAMQQKRSPLLYGKSHKTNTITQSLK